MGKMVLLYAHSLPEQPNSVWETLDDHAAQVARLARQFAEAFHAGDWGELLGQWHDLGKIQPEFQSYICGVNATGTPHAWVGALLATNLFTKSKAAIPLALAIAGHHTGLADLKLDATINPVGSPTPLIELVTSHKKSFESLRNLISSSELNRPCPTFPHHVTNSGPTECKLELFIRFLFSALVDADRVATSRFYASFSNNLSADDLRYDKIDTLKSRLDEDINHLAPKGAPAVVKMRAEVLNACRHQAASPQGRFSLTVPTGGGKTLSAMSFALNHAALHKLDRVIVVIPYTSIIEQSAKVYKAVLGEANVLEHHSNLDEQALTENDSRGEKLRKLAAENWDSPIIVTTTVQFFESLLSNHPGRCRKLHNITNSVVVLDEVQTLPPQFLQTVVDVLAQLTDHYGCTVVLTTATPPALAAQQNPPRIGLSNLKEIIADPSALARQVRRVRIEWRINAPTPYEELAKEIQSVPRMLAIVHRRADARKLAEFVGGDVLHLSAGMCPAHRMQVVQEVHRRLSAKQPCRLVSTQLVEAGVDLDFPVVYRSLAGLDSIAQSAGRCDREGRLTDAAGGIPSGRLIVFRAESSPPPGIPIKAFDSMSVLLKLGGVDPFEPDDSIRFFNELYRKIDNDQHGIEPLRRTLMFAAVAAKFQLIDSDTSPIVVSWGEGAQRLAAYRALPSRETRRALQPFTVQVRKYRLAQLRDARVVMQVNGTDFFDIICEGREKEYDHQFGLNEAADGILAPQDSVI